MLNRKITVKICIQTYSTTNHSLHYINKKVFYSDKVVISNGDCMKLLLKKQKKNEFYYNKDNRNIQKSLNKF